MCDNTATVYRASRVRNACRVHFAHVSVFEKQGSTNAALQQFKARVLFHDRDDARTRARAIQQSETIGNYVGFADRPTGGKRRSQSENDSQPAACQDLLLRCLAYNPLQLAVAHYVDGGDFTVGAIGQFAQNC